MEKLNNAVNNLRIVVSNARLTKPEHDELAENLGYLEKLATECIEQRQAMKDAS